MMKKPSNLHIDLTDERIDKIGHLIARVRIENIESADERDDGWSLGCRAYKWCCSEISGLSITTEWIKIINPTLKFIFAIGNVQVSLYKGLSVSPKKNIASRAQSYPELRQLSLLSNFEIPEKIVWAFAVETDADGMTTNIEFFGMSEAGHVIASRNIPLHNVLSNVYVVNPPPENDPANLTAAPVSLPGVRKDKAVNNENEGNE